MTSPTKKCKFRSCPIQVESIRKYCWKHYTQRLQQLLEPEELSEKLEQEIREKQTNAN